MDNSPVWKKPSEVMKIHRRRKSISQRKVTTSEEKRPDFIYKSPSKATKRRNPFTSSENSANKRQNTGQENLHDDNKCLLFSVLDSAESGNTQKSRDIPKQTKVVVPSQLDSSSTTLRNHREPENRMSQPAQVVNEKAVFGQKTELSPQLPVDWCLKTKLHVVSSRPLAWCTQLKSAEEAAGITHFVQDIKPTVDDITAQKHEFQKSLMYWIHPNLPWVRLFPRIISDSRASKTASLFLQEDVQAGLQAAWEESFTSAFHQLRSGLCPYFYLCTHQLTVLFCESKISQSGIVAMVTPTTRGFREQLQKEGITFTLPVGEKQSSPDIKSKASQRSSTEEAKPLTEKDENCDDVSSSEETVEEGEEQFETDEGASGWLESIGLDKKEFPSLDPRKVKLQREGFQVIDNRPESLVFVEGSDVQALFNFLLNCRTCTAQSGTQAGVPPTILAPKVFKGATLKCHKVKHTVIKQPDKDGTVTAAHIVEISGPILPLHTESVISLYHSTQQADFGVVFNNHDITAPFNILGTLSDKCLHHKHNTDIIQDTNENMEDSTRTKHFIHKSISEKVAAIKEIVCTPDGFSWKS